MAFQKGNKLGFKKREEYQGDETETPVDDEEITVPFVSKYPEGRAEIESGTELAVGDESDSFRITGTTTITDLMPSVKLMFHGALKDDGGKNVQRPIPQTSKDVNKRDFVRIGEDRIGVFTKDEAEYLLRVCNGAFTKVEGSR